MAQPIEIECRAVKSALDAGCAPVLLDCREPDEWDTAKIGGAALVPMSQLPDRLDELEPHRGQPIIVVCHHGVRSLRVASWLREQGFDQARSMSGGIDEWSRTIDQSVPRY